MFADLTYLQLDDGASNDENCNHDPVDEVGIVDIGGLTVMDEDSCFDNVNVLEGSSAPMDWTLTHVYETMAKITMVCIMGISIELCDHATSFTRGDAWNIHHLHLAWVNKSMLPRMVFRRMDDGFKNSINRMKDWHKTMMEHLNTHKKRIKE